MDLLAWFALLVTQPVLPAPMGKVTLFHNYRVSPAAPQQVAQLSMQDPKTCSVRLLEMQIPKDVHFTMQVQEPDAKAMQTMPQAQVPAPPCPK